MAKEFPESYADPLYAQLDSGNEQKLGLPVGLLSSIRTAGEKTNASRVSSAGAQTPYQFTPSTQKAILDKYGIDVKLSPENASEGAGLLLQESLKRNNGDVERAVREYHGGTDPKNWGKVNNAYAGRVLAAQSSAKLDALSQGFAKFMQDSKAQAAPAQATPALQEDALSKGFGEFLQSQKSKGSNTQSPDTSEQPQNASQGGALQEAGRQLGLTARYGIEGVTAGAGALTDPFIQAIGGAVRKVTGTDYDPATLASIGRSVANALGLPEPQTEGERIVGAVTRGIAGAGSGAAVAGQVANVAGGTTKAVAQQLAAQPGMQAISGAAAGGAGQAVQESGGGTGAQLAAALAAGVAAPAAVGSAAGLTQAVKGGTIAPEQQAILDAGKQAGVTVMTSDVLPPQTFLGKQGQAVTERIPVVGTGAVREGQQAARQEAVTNLAAQYGAPSYEAIVSSLKGKVGTIKRAAGSVIDKTGQQLDQVGPVTPTKSVQAIDDAITKLTNPNVYNPGFESQVKSLQDLKDVLSNGQQQFTSLRQSRTAVREMMDSVDAAGRSQLPSYAKKLVGGIYSAMKDDLDDFARANLSQSQLGKLVKANQVYGDEAKLLQSSRLKNVLDKGDITPEVVRNLIYSNKPSENRILFDSLGTAGRQQVKAALIDDAATKALSANGEINPNRFGAELAKHNAKLDVFFRGQDREALKGFNRLLQVTRRAQDAAAAPTTTGATLLPYGLGAAALANTSATIAGAVTAGGFARIYESAPVRDLLLKLNNARPSSVAEGRHIRALAAAFREESQRQQKPLQKESPKPSKQQQSQNRNF